MKLQQKPETILIEDLECGDTFLLSPASDGVVIGVEVCMIVGGMHELVSPGCVFAVVLATGNVFSIDLGARVVSIHAVCQYVRPMGVGDGSI